MSKEQKTAFEAQLSLASYYKVPVVLHIRKAFSEVFAYKNVLKKLLFYVDFIDSIF